MTAASCLLERSSSSVDQHEHPDFVDERDVVTFTGSADTGRLLRAHPRIQAHAVPFNMEADSLNSAILGQDAVPGTPEFDLFVKEVRKEMTVKCGQKCTAVRRIFVPEGVMDQVQEALTAQLAKPRSEIHKWKAFAWGLWWAMRSASTFSNKLRRLKPRPNVFLDKRNHFPSWR